VSVLLQQGALYGPRLRTLRIEKFYQPPDGYLCPWNVDPRRSS
jgi:hypothetical protein